LFDLSQRFKKADKRAKLPKWMGSYIKEENANLSTDRMLRPEPTAPLLSPLTPPSFTPLAVALVQSRKFLRDMAQPFEQSGKSLWGIEELEEKQRGDGHGHDDDDQMDGAEDTQRADQPHDVKMEDLAGEEDYFDEDVDQAALEEMQRAERAALGGGPSGVEPY